MKNQIGNIIAKATAKRSLIASKIATENQTDENITTKILLEYQKIDAQTIEQILNVIWGNRKTP